MNIENYKDYNRNLNIYTKNYLDLDQAKNPSKELEIINQSTKDKVFISNEAKKLLEEQEIIKKDNKDEESKLFEDMLKTLKESSDPGNNPYDSMIKCIQIATRIISGDKVPIKDEQFLMENEPKMYSAAIFLRQNKEKPKKHESLLEDEKYDNITLEVKTNTDSASLENLEIESESNE